MPMTTKPLSALGQPPAADDALAQASKRRRDVSRYLVTAVICVVLLAVPFVTDSYTVSNMTLVVVYAIAILSLDVVTGYTGQVSLGHGGLMALGSYTVALLMVHTGMNAYLSLVLAPLVTVVLGMAFAISALRLSQLYLGLATFALALTVPQFALQFQGFLGGSQGLILNIPGSPFSGLNQGQWIYLLAAVLGIASYGCTRLFLAGRVLRALSAVRDSPRAAVVCGIDIRRFKIVAFTVSSLLAGLAGGLLALYSAFVSPDDYSFTLSLVLFVGLGVAGFGFRLGPLVGAIIVVYLPIVSQDLTSGKPEIAYGALIVLMVMVGRGGLIDLAKRIGSVSVRMAGRYRRRTAT